MVFSGNQSQNNEKKIKNLKKKIFLYAVAFFYKTNHSIIQNSFLNTLAINNFAIFMIFLQDVRKTMKHFPYKALYPSTPIKFDDSKGERVYKPDRFIR